MDSALNRYGSQCTWRINGSACGRGAVCKTMNKRSSVSEHNDAEELVDGGLD